MPRYDFRCSQCGQVVEVSQKMDDPRPTCETCGVEMTKRPAMAGFVLRGPGFFRTDSRSAAS